MFLGLVGLLSSPLSDADRLDQLKLSFEAALMESEEQYAQRRSRLDAGYLQALDRLQNEMRELGKLDELLIVRDEIKRFKADPASGVGSESPVSAVADLQGTYTTTLSNYRGDHLEGERGLFRNHLRDLGNLQVGLVKRDELDAALAVRAEIDALKAVASGKAIPVRPPPGAGAPVAPRAGSGIPPGFTLYYPFDASQDDGRVMDESPNALHGVTNTNPWIAAGKRGGGGDFSRIDRIKLEHDPRLEPGSFTIAAWVKPVAPSSYGRIWDKYEHFKQTGYGFHMDALRPVMELWDPDKKVHKVKADERLPINEWSHVACTFTPGRGALYVDGKLVKEAPVSQAVLGNTSPARIGYDEHRPLRGHLDEVLFYPRALEGWEIQSLQKATAK